jgi:hypothetical protein
MAKKSATKSKPKKRTAKALAAKAKKPVKKVAKKVSAAKAKKAAPAKKSGKRAKVAKKSAAKKAARPVASKPSVRAKTLPKKAAVPPKMAAAALKPAAPKKPTPAAKKAAAPKKVLTPIHRRDGAGHLDPEYAAALLAQSGHHDDDGRAFLGGKSRSKDDLAEELGEEFVQSATSGEADGEESLNRYVEEESGGPFVGSTGGTEFAEGTDASNPASAEREPFPKT